MALDALRFVHILAVVFMSAPLYNLIVVGERAKLGKVPFAVDRYFENILKGATTRCYIYQLTALISGVLLLQFAGSSWTAIFAHSILLAKFILLLALFALLSVVHFRIQPAIGRLISEVEGDEMPVETAGRLSPLRTTRKRLAAFCLFLVITTVILGLQVAFQFEPSLTGVLIALSALFSWHVYRSSVPFGWV